MAFLTWEMLVSSFNSIDLAGKTVVEALDETVKPFKACAVAEFNWELSIWCWILFQYWEEIQIWFGSTSTHLEGNYIVANFLCKNLSYFYCCRAKFWPRWRRRGTIAWGVVYTYQLKRRGLWGGIHLSLWREGKAHMEFSLSKESRYRLATYQTGRNFHHRRQSIPMMLDCNRLFNEYFGRRRTAK